MNEARPLRAALLRASLLLFAIGAFVSITSAGRLVLFHVVGTMAFWSFLPLTAIGSSDYHAFSVLGLARTLVFARGDDEAAVMDALRSGRTVVFDRDARAYGDPELIAVLQREPYVMREQDYGYRGSGWLDRASRVVGWLGVVGLVLLRRRRSE